MKTAVVAVLDIGKTNKKVILFDRALNMVADARRNLDPVEWKGIEVEDTDTLLDWFYDTLKQFSADYEIRAVAISTHGATFTLLDENGALAVPVISYTAAQGEEVQEEFYEQFGDRETLHAATGTADIGFANMAKVMYYIKTRLPEDWANCKHGLFYGPFFAHALTGQMGLEPTFPGNHTYFWDYEAKGWSEVAKQLGADQLFGDRLVLPWEDAPTVTPAMAERCGLPADCKVAWGIHDSNANFMPYMAKGYSDFVLNSTGTWGVMMRNAEAPRLSEDEIKANVFFNQNVLGQPVSTSLITLGMDYDAFRALTEEKDESGEEAICQLFDEQDLFIVPGVLGTGTAFPGVAAKVVHGGKVSLLKDLQESGGTPYTALGQNYYAALNFALAYATAKMLGTCGIKPGTEIFVEGGFAKNRAYCELLALLCPEQTVALTNMPEGTSFGAALTGWMAADGQSLEAMGQEFTIETSPIAKKDFGDLAGYRAAFEAIAQ